MEDIGDEIEKLRIGHDGKGIGAGWHLDKVEVRRLKDSGKVNTLVTVLRWNIANLYLYIRESLFQVNSEEYCL